MPDESLRVPVWCPICSYIMKGKSTVTYYKSGCCVNCYIEFVEDREERWKNGWRPTQEHVQSFRKKLEESTE